MQKPESAYISRLLGVKKGCPEAEQPEITMLYSVYFLTFFERRASRIIWNISSAAGIAKRMAK